MTWLEALEGFLAAEIGLDSESVGRKTVESAARHRAEALGLAGPELYGPEVWTRPGETEALIDEVVVPETWFWRDWDPFLALGQHAAAEWLPIRPSSPPRLLSLPCSSGEEPYSMAMALLEAGLPPGSFAIDGLDVSGAALEAARRAVYSKGSFRGQNLGFRERYFEALPEGKLRLLPPVRGAVEFGRANVLDGRLLAERPPYQVIFCRNLLIYLTQPARERTLRHLGGLLAPGGLLFVGHAETPLLSEAGFESLQPMRAFCFRKAEPGQAIGKPGAKPRSRTATRPRTAGARPSPPLRPAAPGSPPEQPRPAERQPDLLAQAQDLADRGRLDEALEAVGGYLSRNQASPEAHCLMGLIHQARGDERLAEESFNRTLYLQPDHYPALVHLILLLERRGDSQRAEVLRRRARKLEAAGAGRAQAGQGRG